MSVKVAVRCRPLNEDERRDSSKVIIRMNANEVQVIDCIGGSGDKFLFDEALWSVDCQIEGSSNPLATQEVVYKSIASEMLNHVITGYNGCIFAYGQTGSGKTYSMMGLESDPGINPRIAKNLFFETQCLVDSGVECCVEVSFFEIYNEKVRCLLRPTEGGFDDSILRVREHPKFGPFVEGLAKFVVSSEDEFLQLLRDGNKVRTTGATAMNAASSRSHAVFVVTLTQKRTNGRLVTTRMSRLNLVDLAGSERASKTMATGKRFLEGANINKSLTCLGNVISALSEEQETSKTRHIPYRDSVLTWILKDNLGGNSKTLMLATISPSSIQYDETMSTLRYADRAKKIVNKAVVNETNNNEVIAALQKEILLLKSQLGDASDAERAKLSDELAASEAMKKELQMSFEERLAETRRHMEEREAYTRHLEAQRDAQHLEIQNLRDEKERKERRIEALMQRIEALERRKDPSGSVDIERLLEEVAVLESQQNAASTSLRQSAGRDANDIVLREEDLGNVRPVGVSGGRVTVRDLARAFESLGSQEEQKLMERRSSATVEAADYNSVALHVQSIEERGKQSQSGAANNKDMDMDLITSLLDGVDTAKPTSDECFDPEVDDESLVLDEDSDLDIDSDDIDEGIALDEENHNIEDQDNDGDESLQLEEEENIDDKDVEDEKDDLKAKGSGTKDGHVKKSKSREFAMCDNPPSVAPEPNAEPSAPGEDEAPARAKLTTNTLQNFTKTTLVVPSHAIPNNRYLHEPFKVVKVSNTSLIGSRKERIWDVDFFRRRFANLDMAGRMSFEYPASNLYRIDKDPVNSKRLTLHFFEAPHPYVLELTSSERRQRFYEVAMTLRRDSIMWCPSLCIESENDVIVNITGTTIDRPNAKKVKVHGETKILVARMPYEVVDLWYGCFSMRNHPLPRSAAVLGSFLPRDSHDVYVIGIMDISHAMLGVEDIGIFFLNYLGSAQHYVLANTALLSKKRQTNNALVVIVRRSSIVRVSHVEAAETTPVFKDDVMKGDFTAVGCALRINDSSFGIFLVNAKPTNCTALSRAGYIRLLLSGFPFADPSVDIGAGFDYLIVSGAFNFGADHHEDDMLLAQMSASNLMSGMLEAPATSALINAAEPVRIFYAVRPRICRLDVKQYTTSRALAVPNAFISTDVFCRRAFLNVFGEQVQRTQLILDNLCVTSPSHRIPPVFFPELRVSAEWIDSSPVSAVLTKVDDTYTASGRTIPPLIPTVWNPTFLRLQTVTFSLLGLLDANKQKKEKAVIASGVLPLKDILQMGACTEFDIPLYYHGCTVGALAGSIMLVAFEKKNAADLEGVETDRDTLVVSCYENQIFDGKNFVPTVFTDHRAHNFSRFDVNIPFNREGCELPDTTKWCWLNAWRHATHKLDAEGWSYGEGFDQPFQPTKTKTTTVRRRRWVRVMQASDPLTLHTHLLEIKDSENGTVLDD